MHGGISHIASAFSCLEIIYTLYFKGIISNSGSPERNRLILSKGHGALALYAVMSEAGFMTPEKFSAYLQPGDNGLGGEPSTRDFSSIEASTGSLGHGFSVAAGMAMAQKMQNSGAKTFALIGDGECQEGTIWECAISAAAFRLDNFVAILDCNGLQKMCKTEDTMLYTNWKGKFESFGWLAQEVDGHNVEALQKILSQENHTDRPLIIIAHTVKGKGVSIMENNPIWHFRLPNKRELKTFQNELNIADWELK